MKWFVFLFFFGILTSFDTPRSADSKFDLQVSVSAVASSKGWIEFALYKNPDTFAKVGTTYRWHAPMPKKDWLLILLKT